jgi:hypothetical protein
LPAIQHENPGWRPGVPTFFEKSFANAQVKKKTSEHFAVSLETRLS